MNLICSGIKNNLKRLEGALQYLEVSELVKVKGGQRNKYADKEINQYVDAIEKIAKNLDKYSKNCRKRILSGFTINQMIENMNKILEDVVDHPKKEQEQNGANSNPGFLSVCYPHQSSFTWHST